MIRTDSAGFMYGLLRKALLTAALLIALSVSAGCAGADKEQASAEEWHYIQFDNTQKVVYDAFRKACADPFSDEPVGFKDENGEVVRSSDDKVTKAFAEMPRENRIVCELGLGMNPNVKSLCGYTVLDEKMAGTFHIAVGANVMFGGTNQATDHTDFVGKGKVEVE